MAQLPFSFDSPLALALAAAISAAAVAITLVRRTIPPRFVSTLTFVGLTSLCLAAGQMQWRSPSRPRVAVMVDLSSSTRTAGFHDPVALAVRLNQLMGQTPYALCGFADRTAPMELPRLRDEVPSRRTLFEPPPADAVVLFSDAQFELPINSPPVYVVVDPALENVEDIAITRLEAQGDTLRAAVSNRAPVHSAAPLQLSLTNATPATLPLPAGQTILTATLDADAIEASARVPETDAWPENDSLTLLRPPPPVLQHWWISNQPGAPSQRWRTFTPDELPAENAYRYLNVGVIALDNLAADDFIRLQLERIDNYVRVLGGGLMILGGERAFAAGGYAGTPLDHLSPLASDPPRPATHWIVLLDSSGSMSATIGDNTRWHFAADAAGRLLSLLPPSDTVSIGDFARDLRWWASNTTADKIDFADLIPKSIDPTGPTNLEPVLRQLARPRADAAVTQVIIVTDAEAQIDNAGELADALARQRIRISLLTTSPLAPQSPLRAIVAKTAGQHLAERDPRLWPASLQTLLRASAPRWLEHSGLHVHFAPDAPHLPDQNASVWNRTWLKQNATLLAAGQSLSADGVPAVAAWNIAAGAVLSAAFHPEAQIVDALADVVATPPHDPRFTVTFTTGPQLKVTVDAIAPAGPDGPERFLNNLEPRLALASDVSFASGNYPIPQTAPGRYELSVPTPRRALVASVLLEDRSLTRFPVAERYPTEFERIGNNRDNMQRLAAQTGGRVIEPAHAAPIEFPRRRERTIPLTLPLSLLAAATLAAGLALWRRT